MSASLQAAVHRFGSSGGYRVLGVSDGLTAEELSALDPMATGVAELGPSGKDIEGSDAMLVRTLPGGRIGVTRWFGGEPDDAGRPTLELRTLIFRAADWASTGRLLARHLLGDHLAWEGPAFDTGGTVVITPPDAPISATDHDVYRLADLLQPGDMPLRLIRPGVTLRPTRLSNDDGRRIEPPVSSPMPMAARLAAIAQPVPPLEPPGSRSRS